MCLERRLLSMLLALILFVAASDLTLARSVSESHVQSTFSDSNNFQKTPDLPEPIKSTAFLDSSKKLPLRTGQVNSNVPDYSSPYIYSTTQESSLDPLRIFSRQIVRRATSLWQKLVNEDQGRSSPGPQTTRSTTPWWKKLVYQDRDRSITRSTTPWWQKFVYQDQDRSTTRSTIPWWQKFAEDQGRGPTTKRTALPLTTPFNSLAGVKSFNGDSNLFNSYTVNSNLWDSYTKSPVYDLTRNWNYPTSWQRSTSAPYDSSISGLSIGLPIGVILGTLFICIVIRIIVYQVRKRRQIEIARAALRSQLTAQLTEVILRAQLANRLRALFAMQREDSEAIIDSRGADPPPSYTEVTSSDPDGWTAYENAGRLPLEAPPPYDPTGFTDVPPPYSESSATGQIHMIDVPSTARNLNPDDNSNNSQA